MSKCDKNRVVFVAYLCNFGGIETFISRMSRWLTEMGIQVDVLGDKDRGEDSTLIRELFDSGKKNHGFYFDTRIRILNS